MKRELIGGLMMVLAATACGGGGGDDAQSGSGAVSAGGANPTKPGTAPPTTTPPATTTQPPASAGKTLKDEVAVCVALENKELDEDTTSMIQAELSIQDCYKTAADHHAAEIDQIRTKAGGQPIEPPTTPASTFFDDYRQNHASGAATPKALCDVSDAASQNFGGSLQSLERVGCMAQVEARLAKLVVSEAALPGGNVPLTGNDGTADQLHAFIPKIVDQTLANTPDLDRTAVTAEVTAALDGAIAASTELCGVLEDAGQMAGGTGANQLARTCSSKAIGLLVAEVSTWVESEESQN